MIYPLCITLVTLKGRLCVCVYVHTYIYSSKPKDICQNSSQAPFCASQLLCLCGHSLLCLLDFRHLQVLCVLCSLCPPPL